MSGPRGYSHDMSLPSDMLLELRLVLSGSVIAEFGNDEDGVEVAEAEADGVGSATLRPWPLSGALASRSFGSPADLGLVDCLFNLWAKRCSSGGPVRSYGAYSSEAP